MEAENTADGSILKAAPVLALPDSLSELLIPSFWRHASSPLGGGRSIFTSLLGGS